MGNTMLNLTASDGTTASAGLGDTAWVCGALYMYGIADGAIAAYACCGFQNDYDAAELTTAISGARPTLCIIPQFAVADNEYFWGPVGPFFLREDQSTTFKVKAAASCADSVKIGTTTGAGVVDDTYTDLVCGLLLTETITGAEAADCIAVQMLVTNCQD